MIPFITILSGSQAAQAGRLDGWAASAARDREATADRDPMRGQAPEEPATAWSPAQEPFEDG